jgi:hypothetical protein
MKKSALGALLILIFLVVFNVCFFMVIKAFTSSFWVSYAFICFSYILLVLSIVLMPKRKDSTVLGFPVVYLSSLYFVIELILGLAFIFRHADFIVVFISQFILAGIFTFMIVSNLFVNESIKSSAQKSDEDIFYIKNVVSELSMLQSNIADNQLGKKIEKLTEAFRYGQVITNPALAEIESKIMIKIQSLKQSISFGDNNNANVIIDDINLLLSERNSKIKLLR